MQSLNYTRTHPPKHPPIHSYIITCVGAAPPEAVGWEANAEGRLAPRSVDLSAHMSPHALAEQAVDLNLHLMRWRAAPDLDTGRVAATKCLLLGAQHPANLTTPNPHAQPCIQACIQAQTHPHTHVAGCEATYDDSSVSAAHPVFPPVSWVFLSLLLCQPATSLLFTTASL
jgi:hypothetical protein